ncbi:hypothetical protein JTE90_029208 [Oedothorax gibbosus]|nr:hypothetical protein JTE90_029208 [Oedothorax gibbosus]
MPQSSSETPCPEALIYKDNEYDEALNPFVSEDVENNDSILKNPSITVDPQQTAATVNGSFSLVPLANERKKRKSTQKYRAPDPPITMRILPSESATGVNESSPGVNDSAAEVNDSAPGVNESAPEVNDQLQESMISSRSQ